LADKLPAKYQLGTAEVAGSACVVVGFAHNVFPLYQLLPNAPETLLGVIEHWPQFADAIGRAVETTSESALKKSEYSWLAPRSFQFAGK